MKHEKLIEKHLGVNTPYWIKEKVDNAINEALHQFAVIVRFSIGQYVDYKGSEYWVAEDNGDEKVLITNCEDVEDPDYNDQWVNRCDLNAL